MAVRKHSHTEQHNERRGPIGACQRARLARFGGVRSQRRAGSQLLPLPRGIYLSLIGHLLTAATAVACRTQHEVQFKPPPVGMFGLYRFATRGERFLLAIGILCALAVGGIQPAFLVVFGRSIDQVTSRLPATSALESPQNLIQIGA